MLEGYLPPQKEKINIQKTNEVAKCLNTSDLEEKPHYLSIFPCFLCFYGISIPTVKKIYCHLKKKKKSWQCPLFFGLPFHKCYSFSVMDELPCQHYTADFLLSALDFTSGSGLAHTLFTLWGHSCCVFDCYLKSLDLCHWLISYPKFFK